MHSHNNYFRPIFSFGRIVWLTARIAVAGSVILLGDPVDAAYPTLTQLKLLDVSDEWTKTRIFKESDNELGNEQPEKWGEPANFQYGTMHIRLEILSKPSDLEIISMLCLWQNGNESCTRRQDPNLIRFTKPGVYYGSYPAPGEGDDVLGSEKWGRPSAPHAGKHYFRGTDNADRVLL